MYSFSYRPPQTAEEAILDQTSTYALEYVNEVHCQQCQQQVKFIVSKRCAGAPSIRGKTKSTQILLKGQATPATTMLGQLLAAVPSRGCNLELRLHHKEN